ncbi:MAG: ferrous iron transport protein B [Anaerolineae bacterium]|nr:ferrous iron transport protein B [Anaerolineae bacterium]
MSCHDQPSLNSNRSIALVGHANVGKSVIFQKLTGMKTIVSNYPGTTVEISQGSLLESDQQVIDTPGVVTLPSYTEDEALTMRMLLEGDLSRVVQVGDAKNLVRTLSLTILLAEMNIPMTLALNMVDEAQKVGMKINYPYISAHLNIPVIPTTATRGEGIRPLRDSFAQAQSPGYELGYPPEIEQALGEITPRIPQGRISRRALALLFLCADQSVESWVEQRLDPAEYEKLQQVRSRLNSAGQESPANIVQKARLDQAEKIADSASIQNDAKSHHFGARLGRLAAHPFWGVPILLAALYAIYWFVGVVGAQVMVNWLEVRLFGEVINPWLSGWVTKIFGTGWAADFLVGDYGIWTMGMTYAIALILPIVSTFFLAFSIVEDTGYLPRLAALSNNFFKRLGLNGKAVLPMVLGLGCVTMATVTTRTLESKRERFLVTLLLALAVPCSAQLGIVMGMLASVSLAASVIWAAFVLLILLAVGWLANKFVRGERSALVIEFPPMRLPLVSNVVMKTLARMEWYMKEVIPIFIFGAAAMFILDKIGLISTLIDFGRPLTVGWLGLPEQASAAFVLGFLRRDFGATGLFLMNSQGLMTPVQVIVAMVTITLFIPCIASVLMIGKEYGWRTAAGMVLLVFPLAFAAGGLLNRILLLSPLGV